MVEPIDDAGEFAEAHEMFETIKIADEKVVNDVKQPGTIIFIGDNTATKEEIYGTLFG